MPKALTIMGLAVSVLMLLLFVLDLIGYFLFPAMAPFRGASLVMDVTFAICAVVLGYLSWSTYKDIA